MELTKNGINCTNIKKDFRIFQMPEQAKSLIYQAKQPEKTKKAHCKRLQKM
jgi:hypothetical protein